MRHHRVDQGIIGQRRIIQTKVGIACALFAQQGAGCDPHPFDELHQQRARRRGLQILDHMRLDARVADHRERVARRAAGRVVIDHDVHGQAFTVAVGSQAHASAAMAGAQISGWPWQQSRIRNAINPEKDG